MSEHRPDKWVIIKFSLDGESSYKVLGGWSGGYTQGDSWRLSSGLEEITEDENFYLMKNYSGSVYKCNKSGYGFTALSGSIFSQMEKQCSDEGANIKIISVEDFLNEN